MLLMTKKYDRLKMLIAMCIYGSIGIFIHEIQLPRAAIALFRGVCGGAFLILLFVITRRKFDFAALRGKMLPLVISGVLMGLNWVFLFVAYDYAGVAVSTLCYYTAPMFVLLLSPLVLHEKLTARHVLCIFAALCGTALISHITAPGNSFFGVLLALAAALLYAAVIFFNKKLADAPAYERTVIQLLSSALPLIPYVCLTASPADLHTDARTLIFLLTVGLLHTGVAYALYFDAVAKLPTRTVAMYAYLDPVLAVLFSVLFLGEPLTVSTVLGAALILGAAFVSER